jgi:hypothetical protein
VHTAPDGDVSAMLSDHSEATSIELWFSRVHPEALSTEDVLRLALGDETWSDGSRWSRRVSFRARTDAGTFRRERFRSDEWSSLVQSFTSQAGDHVWHQLITPHQSDSEEWVLTGAG